MYFTFIQVRAGGLRHGAISWEYKVKTQSQINTSFVELSLSLERVGLGATEQSSSSEASHCWAGRTNRGEQQEEGLNYRSIS